MVTKFRLQLFADNGKESSAPFFVADVRPDTVGHVIALFSENQSPEGKRTTEEVSIPRRTTERRRGKGGKVVRGITRDLTALLASHRGQTVTVDLCSSNLRHYTRRQVANCLYCISSRGELLRNVGRGKYEVLT